MVRILEKDCCERFAQALISHSLNTGTLGARARTLFRSEASYQYPVQTDAFS
jgi:hypothetical protein